MSYGESESQQGLGKGRHAEWEALSRDGQIQLGLDEGWRASGADRLKPSAKDKRVRFCREKRTLVYGPFSETKELVGGYWL